MRKHHIRSRLTLLTSSIILIFLTICTGLFYVFLTYFAQVIEQVYGIDDDILQPFFSIFSIVFILLIIFALIASILGGFFVSEHFLRNVVQFTQQIKAIKEEGLEKRLPLVNNDELDDLGKEFNDLIDDIEQSIQKQNQFVSDASHELKTPLAIMNGNLDMLQRWGKTDPAILSSSLAVMKLEVERMISLTSELLQLTEQFDTSNLPTISIETIIERVAQEYKKLYPDFAIDVAFSNAETIAIKPEHIEQMLMILLDNAIKYSKAEQKHIEITYRETTLSIKDFGIGIEKAEIHNIFDRLYRIDEARENKSNSFGLGLSILKRMSEWYDVTITVESEKNKYTMFILKFNGGQKHE